ncbi:hypothetical protein B0H12DRAFT_1154632 [Mycena haematopus]|nr:hypothetical protein B0H12DRAFT_1154632 [Mycena haematopus]
MFRFLPTCGHGLCIGCSEQTFTNRNCAICRQPKGPQECIQIFLTFCEAETTPVQKAHTVAENLAKIGSETMPHSVQKAGQKIRRVVRDLESEDQDVARELLDAAKNLDERIYPLFLELELANDQIAALIAQREELRRQLKVAESREDELTHLRRSFANAQDIFQQTKALLKQAKDDVSEEHAHSARLARTVQRHLSELSLKEEENEKLRAKLTRRDNRISLLEKKLKLLSRTPKPLISKPVGANDPDESLQIDNSVEGIRVARKSNDWLEPERPGVIRKNMSRKVLKRIQPGHDVEL